jgi:hypothetical protein
MENAPFRFPLTAMPGDYATGPDGRRYRLDYDDRWYVTALERRADDKPIPHVSPDDPERIAAEKADAAEHLRRTIAEEAAAAEAAKAQRIAALEKQMRADAAKDALAAQASRPDPEDMTVDLYEGDYADVLAETPDTVRVDGWTGARRVLFLERLEEQGSIIAAARAAGMSRRAVYRLLPRAPAFAAAFAKALAAHTATLADTLFDRAIHGHEVPIFHNGELVGTRTVHHDRLGIYLLRVRDPLNYAPIDELEPWKRERAIDAAASEAPALPSPRPPEWPLTAPRDSATLRPS